MFNIDPTLLAYSAIVSSIILFILGISVWRYSSKMLQLDLRDIDETWLKEKAETETLINKDGSLKKTNESARWGEDAIRAKISEYINYIDYMNSELVTSRWCLLKDACIFVFGAGAIFSFSYGTYLSAMDTLHQDLNFDIWETILSIYHNSFVSFFLLDDKDISAVLTAPQIYWPTVFFSWVGLVDVFALTVFTWKILWFAKPRWQKTKKVLENVLKAKTEEDLREKLKQAKEIKHWLKAADIPSQRIQALVEDLKTYSS